MAAFLFMRFLRKRDGGLPRLIVRGWNIRGPGMVPATNANAARGRGLTSAWDYTTGSTSRAFLTIAGLWFGRFFP